MAQTSPQMTLETVEPSNLLLIPSPSWLDAVWYSRLIERKEMSALGHEQTSWLVALDVSFRPEADAVLCSSIVPRTSARLLHPTPALNEP
jgi:hypothetical protein